MIKKAIYPGSFDPFTNGHLSIVKEVKTDTYTETQYSQFENKWTGFKNITTDLFANVNLLRS